MKRFLIDTQAFLWFSEGSKQLSIKASKLFLDTDNQLFFSVASIWELAIKIGLGKLKLEQDLKTLVSEGSARNRIEILPVFAEHAYKVQTLSSFHRDPFDRLLVVQAEEEKLDLISNDKIFDRYDVARVW